MLQRRTHSNKEEVRKVKKVVQMNLYSLDSKPTLKEILGKKNQQLPSTE